MPSPQQNRCAVYTRKSHEDGLEQDFNSLDAQRESCDAYIFSQKSEGWISLPTLYDDGGISGATMERPALKRLMSDIDAGLIDTIVVYKVDRLTRSLSDFARIVDVLDHNGVSFVSVTQQFNTTTSMGRLTLNMLLSFAQFEREVTGERIRDKIAASKKKGMWMGGLPPLGYDAENRTLMINDAEAATVRHIYQRYLDLGSVRLLRLELDRVGIVSKHRVDRYGRTTGGKPLARGALYHMLQNRLYRGEIVHKDKSYPGTHKPIVDDNLWEAVQSKLSENRQNRVNGTKATEPSLLAGLIFDETGQPMSPTHATKKGVRYRYYVSRNLVSDGRAKTPGGRRIPAADLESLVEKHLCEFLSSESELHGAVEPVVSEAHEIADLIAKAADFAIQVSRKTSSEKRCLMLTIIDRIILTRESLELQIKPDAILTLLGQSLNGGKPTHDKVSAMAPVTITMPAKLKRAGIETRLLVDKPNDAPRRQSDRSLHRVLGHAQRFQSMVMHNQGKTIRELASEAGVGGSYFARVLRLSFLAPEVAKAILKDRHPVDLTARKITGDTRLPTCWADQRAALGFD